jgi:hypothetical protein
MASSNEDNIDKAVDLAIAGKTNIETFKKFTPESYAAVCQNDTFDSAFESNLRSQIKQVAQNKLMVHPELTTQEIRYRLPNQPDYIDPFRTILGGATLVVGIDQKMALVDKPYMPILEDTSNKQIKHRGNFFSAAKKMTTTNTSYFKKYISRRTVQQHIGFKKNLKHVVVVVCFKNKPKSILKTTFTTWP